MQLPNMQVGARNPDVGNWQRFLNANGMVDDKGVPLVVDEAFGTKTHVATLRWQRLQQLTITGIVTTKDRVLAAAQGYVPFVQAKNATILFPKTRIIDLAVLHSMENDEKPITGAEDVALWFAGKNPKYAAPIASAHYLIDRDSMVQGVRDHDVAWHAPGANHNGIGIEHAGRASQTPLQWDDPESRAILLRSAQLSARLVRDYQIPITWLSVDDLLNKARGFCSHDTVTKAFPGPGRSHWDPGPNFPHERYLDLVREACLAA